ncbi:hypothetical protein I3760_03G053600 [Carya illinoinensis]|nr:hypothetical protein I3760_03G053600 [Carya illinoinensis]
MKVESTQVYMAVVPICSKMTYKDQRGFMYGCMALADGPRSFASLSSEICKRWHISYLTIDTMTRTKTRKANNPRHLPYGSTSTLFRSMTEVTVLQMAHLTESHLRFISGNDSRQEKLYIVRYASESVNNEKQLRSLDSYFGKLQDDAKSSPSVTLDKTRQIHNGDGRVGSKTGLSSLNDYLGKLNKDEKSENYHESFSTLVEHTAKDNQVGKPFSISDNSKTDNEEEPKSFKRVRNRYGSSGPEGSQDIRQDDETSNLYLIGGLVSINIAVFLFEMASPIRNSEVELLSLPLLYGAKINDLILVGEWWRLVTPMFLHSGALHMALGCWGLLTFGPQVCRVYGSFTFFLIYILGGISGNLTSFLHTPEPTVGGTGPVFAIIGAWLIYQLQNKDVIAKDVSVGIFQKAIIITALGFLLSNFGPIDDWTHFGAAFTGIAYGFFTCPTLQLDDASSRAGQEEGITLVRRYADPCKSLIFFTIFIVVLSSLLFFIEPPLNALASDNFAQLWK